MGNYRFRISNMIPSSWFYKPKDTGTSNEATSRTTRKQPITSSSLSAAPTPQPTEPHHEDQPAADQRKSYYFTRDLTVQKEEQPPPVSRLPDPTRKSSSKRRSTSNKKPTHRKPVSGELNSGRRCCCRVTPEPVWTQSHPDSTSSDGGSGHESLNCPCKTNSSSDDILKNVDLPPIITKPEKSKEFGSGKWVIEEGSKTLSVGVVKEGNMGVSTKERSPVRRFPGGKAKANSYSPRVGSRVRVQAINGGRRSLGNRRSLSESMAVVKTSLDPQRDFKESMVEMMMANNMTSSKDLEDLLACYLSLNSEEYHDLIIKVFKQIWFESTDIRL